MKVFVAGATGVLGMAAVRRLVTAGHTVTGVARDPAKGEGLVMLGATPAYVDIFDRGAVATAMSGHDVVCNLATRIPTGTRAVRAKAWRENDRVRADGSRVLVNAAVDAGTQRFVQEAVALVYADGGDQWIDETFPVAPAPPLRSSIIATNNALGFATDGRFAVVLRFGLVYGDDAMTHWQLAAVRRGRPVLFGSPSGFMSPLHLDDAASAVLAALGSPSGVYNVAAEPLRRSEVAIALGDAAGAEPARFVPPLLQRSLGWRSELAGRSLRLSTAAFHSATGWQARVPFTAGWPALSHLDSDVE